MNILQKYLIIIYICLSLTYGFDLLENRANSEALIPVLIMLGFVNISVVAAFFSKRWIGQLLLYTNFLFVGLIPFVLGVISLWVNDQRTRNLLKYTSGIIPLVLLVLSLYVQLRNGNSVDLFALSKSVFYRIIQTIYWVTVFLYSSTHLKPELEKIEKKV